jgi:DNA-binding CsgD family transcriptional regulator/tetratricopeptide (TPR) repeat protein
MGDMAELLVGRAQELALLERTLARVEEGRACTAALVGEPGIGKTRLLGELERLAGERGHLVLAGRASELEHDLPYWVFVDALDEALRSLDPDRLERVDQALSAELARILPAFAGLDSGAATVLDERYLAHRAVRELLERLAAARPLVLVLDDLHWADPASIELLSGLLRRPPQAMVLLALALRPRQAPSRLVTALEHAAQAGSLQCLELHPLSSAEAEELLGRSVKPHVARALYQESGGNPFYLEQLARAMHPDRASDAAAVLGASVEDGGASSDGEPEVPPAVTAALAEELGLLSPRARGLLQGAAVVGDPFELELAAAAAAASDADAGQALDELLCLDLVRRTDAPRRFRFRHPLVRRAVHAATHDGWRIRAHARVAGALAARGDSAEAQAHHVAQSARRGDLQAVTLLRDAADAAALRAPASAARWYRAALDLLPDGAERQQRVRLLGPLARVLAGMGQLGQSRAALLELLELVPPEDAGERVKLIAACAGVEHLMGQHAKAHARLAVALDQLPDQGSADAVALMLDLAADAFYRADYGQMRQWGLRARARAAALGHAPLTGAAGAAVSLASAFVGRSDEAEQYRVEVAAIVDALSDAELALRLDAASHLVAAELYLDRYHDAAVHARRGLEVGRATGQGQLFPQLTQSEGVALAMLGRLEEAAEVFDGAIDAARLTDNPQSLAWTLFNRSWTALLAGDLELALRTGEEALDLVRGLDDSMISPFVTGFLGAALLEAGEPARCLDLLIPAAGGPGLPLVPGGWNVAFQEVVTLAWLALWRQREAERSAARAETTAAALGLKLAASMAYRARAAVTLAAGNPLAAAETALASAQAADAVDAPIEAARARTVAGRALAAAGDRAGAVAELERAAAALDACGAVRYRDQAERALRRLGGRYQRGQRADGDAAACLTRREAEIAKLVQAHKTNREIAAELFLSQKTVETHLRHIFGKLGVSSRVSLARVLDGRS